MKNSSGRARRCPFYLIEALVYLSVLTFILSGFLSVFRSASMYSRNAITHSLRFEDVRITHEHWKRAINGSTPASWGIQDEAFHIGEDIRIVQDSDKLLFYRSGAPILSRRLPMDTRVEFQIEQDHGPARAVLTIRWPSQRLSARGMESVRLVACGASSPDAIATH